MFTTSTQVQDDLVDKFLAHARVSPNDIAILTSEISLSYRELYIEVLFWKTVLKPHLQNRTLLVLERTPRLIAILLALQWLEITYIPVDPATPIERLRAILDDSKTVSLLYDTAYQLDYTSLDCQTVDLNLIAAQQAKTKAQLLANKSARSFSIKLKARSPKLDKIAYIIYTSGTTGKPKGVAISQRALTNFLLSMSRFFLTKKHELLLAITTIAFDIAVLELFLPLWQKKMLFLANQAQNKDPFSLKQLLDAYPVTLLQATPSMWNMLETAQWSGKAGLTALCGGEPLTPALAQHLLKKADALWNMYGPTEATVWCSLKQILPNQAITIGRPIHNMDMFVLDGARKRLPPYIKGELYIGGLSLANGYVNNPMLNQERFISYKHTLGKRLYRTGDIACMTAEGEFILFGRLDNQVKLHGYRIELEEIEAHIQTFAGVQECIVNVHQDQLIAYLKVSKAAEFSEDALKQHLTTCLPDYMLPQRFIILNNFPLSLSGKINRKALPAPSFASTNKSNTATPVQQLLIHIWSEELAIPHLSIHDNFFALGGHSLLATRIVLKIAQHLGKQVRIHDFYQAPTIAQFTTIIEQTPENQPVTRLQEKSQVSIKPRRWLPLNDFQLTLWLSTIFEPKVKKINVAARKRLQGPLNKTALDLALKLVFKKHEILSYSIRRFYPAQKLQSSWSLKWSEYSLLTYNEDQCESHLAKSINELFYYETWTPYAPMVLARLFYLQQDKVELQISMSHLIADESSLDIFFQDLANAYLFYTQHTTLDLDEAYYPLRLYFLQEKTLLNQYEERDILFWKNYLQDTGLLYIPDQYVSQEEEAYPQFNSTYAEITESSLENLSQFCATHYVTLNDVLCACIGLSFQTCCTEDLEFPPKLFMNTVKSTRDNPLYDKSIGCFLRIHPIKLDLHQGKNLLHLAKQAQQSTLETTEYQRAPSLVKLASIGQLPFCKKTVQSSLLSLAGGLFSKLSQYLNFRGYLLKNCSSLLLFERKNHFLINVNILNNFLPDNKKKQTLFDKLAQKIPSSFYPTHSVKFVFDVCFYRDPSNQKPFVVITSNLTKDFREHFARILLKIMAHCDCKLPKK